MMEAVVAIAGAVYLTDKLFALVAWIEKEKALPRAPASRTGISGVMQPAI